MVGPEPENTKVSRIARRAGRSENLPHRVELWDVADRNRVERVLARALNAPLARAIFNAAQTEHPERRITLRRGSRLIADTAK
jgi:hypothetical protein